MTQSPTENALFVGGLTQNVSESHLREIFGHVGKVYNVRIARNKHGHSLGWGIVQFVENSSVQSATSFMNGGQLDGCVLTARPAVFPQDAISSEN